MKPGDLVKTTKGERIGIIVEVFGDLNPDDPWIRVRWTHPVHTYEWCKKPGLVLAKEGSVDVI